jgi:signal transduction histidine kinase
VSSSATNTDTNPHKRTGVRVRLGRAFALQIVLISVAVIGGVFAIAYVVSGVLSRQALEGEATHFFERIRANPEQPLPDTANMIGFLARGEDASLVPESLRSERPGYRRIAFEGQRPLLYVVDGPPGRLYLVFQQERVSDLVLYFGIIPGALVLLVIYAMSFVTYRLSARAVSPLVELAARLEAYDPLAAAGHALALDDLRGDDDAEVSTVIEALERFTRRLESFVMRERQFTGDASHELRTPIAVLRACLDLLDRQPDRPAQDARAIERMRQTVSQMQSLIETLLLLAREEEVRSAAEDVSINAVVKEQIEAASELCRATGSSVAVRAAENLHVRAPARLVAIALGNLLRNAIRYSAGEEVEVVVEGGRVRIVDRGVGMSAAELERAFEPFYRADAARAEPGSGFGLGLAIVRRLVNQFGWSLVVASAPGQGTTVELGFRPAPGEQGVRIRPLA